MSFYHHTEADFENWKLGMMHIDLSVWSTHDHIIQTTVAAFDRFHSGRSGYVGPRWELVKAVVWIESGGPNNSAWKNKPMQIGVRGDLGIVDVTTKPEMALFIPPEIRRRLDAATIRNSPAANIEAGLALMHRKMAFLSRKPKTNPHLPGSETAALGDAMGRAVWTLATRNQAKLPIMGSKPHHRDRRAHEGPHALESYICAWLPFCPVTIYQRYNVGDNTYVRKLEFCMKLMGH